MQSTRPPLRRRLLMPCALSLVLFVSPGTVFPGPDEPIFVDGFESGASCTWDVNVTPELCDLQDNDCNGLIDDGDFADPFEPNDSCAAARALTNIGSDETWTFNTLTIFPDGDEDVFRFVAQETDSSCACCDQFCQDEDYRLTVDLGTPAQAGTYELCVAVGTCDFPANSCTTVVSGSTSGVERMLDGACFGSPDTYTVFIRVRAVSSPGFSCLPYELTYSFISGVCK